MRHWFSRGVTKAAMVLVSGVCLGMLGLMNGDTAGAASFNNGGASPVSGDINLTFAINGTLTLDVQTDATATPATSLTGAADTVNFGSIAITPAGCAAATTTGACYLVGLVAPTQVNLVGALQAHVTCAGFSTMGLYIYRVNDPLAAGSLPTGRVRFMAGTPGATSSPGEVVATWTANGTGTAVQETASATGNGSLTSALIPSGSTCTETWVDYELAARVLSTDTTGTTTPITHRLFAAP